MTVLRQRTSVKAYALGWCHDENVCIQARTNGLYRFSSPMVVAGPCPGYTFVSSGNVYSFSRMERANWSKSPPGKSVRPMEPWNNVSPAKTTPSNTKDTHP